MAAVFCASFSRRAMVWRSRVIFTRSSRAASSAGDGARTCTAAAVCGDRRGRAAARSIAASMSPLVTRPSLPVPATVGGVDAALGRELAHRRRAAASSAASPRARRRPAARLRLRLRLPPARLRPASAAGGLGGRRRAGAFRDLRRAARRPRPSRRPWRRSRASTPAAGAGTSSVTLSVSSSTSGSSTATASPAFLNHLPMVASVTDSPSVGTRISVPWSVLSFCSRRSRQVAGCFSREALRRGTASSCARCFDIRPVAVEAEAGRPA